MYAAINACVCLFAFPQQKRINTPLGISESILYWFQSDVTSTIQLFNILTDTFHCTQYKNPVAMMMSLITETVNTFIHAPQNSTSRVGRERDFSWKLAVLQENICCLPIRSVCFTGMFGKLLKISRGKCENSNRWCLFCIQIRFAA